jgi:Xaa-Pro aminopeptidase
VAVAQGVPLTNGYQVPRQSNSFYYLCGIETPSSYLVLDGRSRKVALYLPPRNERLERSEGKVLSADDAELARRLVGVDEVRSTDAMRDNWPLGRDPATAIYAEFAPAEGYAQSRGELQAADIAVASDAWDGRLPRESRFLELLRVRNPRVAIRDLSPILDTLRAIKSPREIALIRRASQIAGLGLMEAVRSAEPGVFEYQLDAAARYVFLLNGARLDAYRSITASGAENINNAHYYRNAAALKDGDLVLMDYAPDYRYYVSDIGRMWPVNGAFTPTQRELVQFVLEYRNAILARVRPGVSAAAIREEAKVAMEAVFARTRFSKDLYEKAARRLVDTGGGVFSHTVGMAVHDVGSYLEELRPGHVFSIDPQLRVPEENVYIRYEDTVVVTDTGVENFTAFLPSELRDLEALAREKGIVQKLAPEQ